MSHSNPPRGATSSRKRPRIEGPAKEMQRSNSTMTRFLGGKQKDWMVGASCEGRHGSHYQIAENHPHTPDTTRMAPTPAPSHIADQAVPRPMAPASPQPQPESSCDPSDSRIRVVTETPNVGSLEQSVRLADPSLPSPSPSDDAHAIDDLVPARPTGTRQQGVVQTTQLLNKQQNIYQAAHNHSPSLSPKSAKLASLVERYGSIDELEKCLEAAAGNKRSSEPILVDAGRSATQSGIQDPKIATATAQTYSQWSTPPAPRTSGIITNSHSIVPSTPNPDTDLLASGLQRFLPAVQWRLRSIQASPVPAAINRLEESRLVLIHKACLAGDVFYLVLHQIFCLYNLPTFPAIEHFNESHIHGFRKLAELVLKNTGLTLGSVQWFSQFPLPFESLLQHSSIYQAAYADVKHGLERLGRGWDFVKGLCLTRREPPLVDFMEAELAIKSPVLQEIVYVAIHRILWVGTQDECFADSAALFNSNQKMSQEWRIRRIHGNPPSEDEVATYYQRLVGKYQHLQHFHLQHVQQGSPHGGFERQNMAMRSSAQQQLQTMQRPLSVNSSRPARGRPTPSIGIPIETLATNALADPTYPTQGSIAVPPRPQSSVSHQTSQGHPRPASIIPSSRCDSSGLATPARSPVTASPVNSQPNLLSTGSLQHITSHHSTIQPVPAFNTQDPNSRLFFQPEYTPPSTAAQACHFDPLLHQAHLRDPELIVETSGVRFDSKTSYYQYFKELACEPALITPQSRNVYCRFAISLPMLEKVSRSEPQLYGAPARRVVRDGSCIFRLRCIKLPRLDEAFVSRWPLEETSWPNNCAIQFNGTPLELRRKVLHDNLHDKDLPVDLTNIVKGSGNEVHAAILRTGAIAETDPIYALAVETIEIGDLNTVKGQVGHVDETGMQERIKKRFSTTDGDIEVLSSNLNVDVTDPFSSSLIKTPVRARSCLHAECFDLENFLQTRQGSVKGSPCNPEQFRCPICKSDARPQCLVVDQWVVNVLEEIGRMNRLDARSIIVDSTGSWHIKEEETEGETGDGTGKRKRALELATAARLAPKPSVNEIIEID
ncbi:hypothetical protein MMC13_005013 [Lambiella insularis]|nr:hypothetical protein [Lambiella insularis]